MDNLSSQEKYSNKDIYFSNVQSDTERKNSSSNKSKNSKKKKKKKSGVASTYLFFLIVITGSMLLSIYAIYCMNDILALTKPTSSITVSFSQNVKDTKDKAASDVVIDTLAKNDLIKCKEFCKFFVKLRDKLITSSHLGGPYEAGVYYLNGKMGLEGMLITIQGGVRTDETIKLTFPEGYTVPEIVEKLAENDVCDKKALLAVIQTTQYDFDLTKNIKADEKIPYRLEGFLFPDTYEFFIGDSAGNTIQKLVDQADMVYTEKYRDRAKELGLTDYEIITIASIIQKEAANDDQMKTISAVIHNRLDDSVNFPFLGCQSTADYITNKVAPALTSTASHTADYYMTYYNTTSTTTQRGLPPGPICCPGKAAIEAALYPSNSSAKYFFHDNEGVMYTARTNSEFKRKLAKYAPYLDY